MRSFVLALLVCCTCFLLRGQDAHFSQFYNNPLYLNPAMTGVFEGQFRFNLNFRQQWSSVLGDVPYQSYTASVDYRWNIRNNDYIAFGLNALRDESGSTFFNQSKAQLSLAIHKQLTGNRRGDWAQYLIAAGQFGYAQNQIDYTKLSYSNQFDGTSQVFDPLLGTGELLGNNQHQYADFNAGILWYALFGAQYNLYAGAALMHINQPDYSFYESSEEKLQRRWVGHIGGQIGLSESVSLLPGYIFMKQGNSIENSLGGNFRFSNNTGYKELALRLGLWWRAVNGLEQSINSESFIISSMLEMDNWLFGLSYDLNNSILKDASNTKGAVELSLSYKHPEKKRMGKVRCPKF